MLSIRARTILIIIAIVIIITAFTMGTGLVVGQRLMMQTVENTLLSVSGITSGMLSAEIGRMKEETRFIAEYISKAGMEDIQDTLDEQLREKKDPSYLALTVLGKDGSLVFSGDNDARPPVRSRESEHGRRAFAGETILTGTVHTAEGVLVMYIWTPVDKDRVLAASLPGLYLSDFLSPYKMWKTGSFFILDHEGVMIATNHHHHRVLERHNYIEWGKRDAAYRKMGEVFENVIRNDQGIEYYPLLGEGRICVYHSINGTTGWSAAVTAPLAESHLSDVRLLLLVCTAICLGLGVLAAILTANSIANPYEKMAELRKTAETASESKTRFLANMSHEMRTPLNAIIGLSELELGTANLESNSFTNIEKIYSAGISLLGIINDLLDISKIESGKFILIPIEYDVAGMINDTINLNIVRIGSKPIQFRLHINGSLPLKLKGDELRVKQIFNNLLSNAIKYTDSGYVDWSISCKQDENRTKIQSTIQDTGIGLHKEELAKLFKDYYQANLQTNYYVEGTGLGLSITKNLIMLMGGDISVKSEYGKGSGFTVEFYQENAGDKTIGDEAAGNLMKFRYAAQRRSRNQKLVRADMSYAAVLVVDDVVTNLDVTMGMLKPYGIAVDCVTSAEEAIYRVKDENVRYNAIFMDHMMPGMDGVEAAKIIRNEIDTEYARNVPLIALTANAILGNDSLFLDNGFQAFLSKPIDILRLDQILNQFVRDKEKEKILAHTPVKEGEPAREEKKETPDPFEKLKSKGINTADGLARFDNDRESYIHILRSFATHLPEQIETVKKTDDMESYRIAVHSIKGSGRNLGAQELGDRAEKMEKAAKTNDRDFINANNAGFIDAAEKLIADINEFLNGSHGEIS